MGWEELPQRALELENPKIDPEANIEFLLRSTIVSDRDIGSARRRDYYYRLKVFTEKGVKELDVINLFYSKGSSTIKDFAARVTNPDGSTFELSKSDLYDRTIYESRNNESNAKSFSFPQLQVGSIVEYSWTEVKQTSLLWGITLFLQGTWPTHELYYEVIPSRYRGSTIRTFNKELSVKKTEDSHYVIKAKNLLANVNEPFSPPDRDVKPWIFMRYVSDNDLLKNQEYWNSRSKTLHDWTDQYVRPKQKAVKKLAKELFEGIEDPEERLKRAFDYCVNKIDNIYSAQSGFTDEQREKLKDVDTPGETIKRGYGSGFDVNNLFASLAIAAGFEACNAQSEDNSRMSFIPEVLSTINLPESIIAIRKQEEDPWRFFDLGYAYLQYEYLDADNMNAVVLIADKNEAVFTRSRNVPANFSEVSREADLEISKYGDLSGDIKIEYSGYPGIWRKRHYDSLSNSEREKEYLSNLKKMFPRGKITEFQMDNIFSRNEPLVVHYKIEIPEYAESLGKRIFFQPNFFEYGSKAPFTKTKRRNAISYKYAWKEFDIIWITLPEGYELEEGASPGSPFDYDFLTYKTVFGLNKSKTRLQCRREFHSTAMRYNVDGYDTIKALYDLMEEQDTHVLTLVKK